MSSQKKRSSNRRTRQRSVASAIARANLASSRVETDVIQLLHQAVDLHRAGNRAAAAEHYHDVLQVDPQNVEATQLLGAIALQVGEYATAIEWLSAAIRLKPGVADFYLNLGSAWQGLNDFEKAIEFFRTALQLNDSLAMAHNNLANALRSIGLVDQAMPHYAKAIALEPGNGEFLSNRAAGQIELGELAEAEQNLQRAIEINPRLAQAHCNLAIIAVRQRDVTRAMESYQTALRYQPNLIQVWNNLGHLLEEQGAVEEAQSTLQQAAQLAPQPFRVLRAQTVCPVIPQSTEEIEQYRERLAHRLTAFQGQPLGLQESDWNNSHLAPPFYLAYHGRNDRALKTQWANLMATEWEKHSVLQDAPEPRSTGRTHVGFVVGDRHAPVFWRFMGGFVSRLASAELKVSVVGSGPTLKELNRIADQSQRLIGPVDRSMSEPYSNLVIPHQLPSAARAIQQAGVDVLFHFEPGVDAFGYFLPFLGAARVQCTSWGIPVTSGIPAMQDYLSSQWLEPADAEDHYSERLWQLKHLPSYYFPPPAPSDKRKSDFGFQEKVRLYGCLQSLFKLHPDFDEILASILRSDPCGRVVLLEGRHVYWTHLLQQRLTRAMPDVADRIVFLPQQNPADFLALAKCCDVLLDPFPFGGGATTLDSISVGAPIVTLPGELMRCRVTSACWQQIGLQECIATDSNDYVERSVQLATDRTLHQSLQQKILDHRPNFYENQPAVEELREWMLERTGQ